MPEKPQPIPRDPYEMCPFRETFLLHLTGAKHQQALRTVGDLVCLFVYEWSFFPKHSEPLIAVELKAAAVDLRALGVFVRETVAEVPGDAENERWGGHWQQGPRPGVLSLRPWRLRSSRRWPSRERRGRAAMAGEPFGDLPRQRLVSAGAAALTDAELLSLLLKGGRVDLEAVEQIRSLLHELGGLGGLPGSSVSALKKHGAREGHAVSLVAVVEIARRLASAEIPECDPMGHPREVARYLSLTYAGEDQEILGALFLNCRQRLLGCREIYRGTMTRVAVEPRAILKEALLANAASFVLFHTHPNGDPEPSDDDLNFTHRLAHAADAVGLCLKDHLVVCASGRWVSLRERGRVRRISGEPWSAPAR